MKPIAIFLSLVLLMVNANAADKVWSIAQSKNPSNGHVIVFRYISEFAPGFSRAKQATRVIILWRYQSEGGMPSQVERKQMDELEDLLQPAIEATGIATLAIVSTGEGLRDWTYYVTSEEVFFRKLNEALKSKPKFPVEIHVGPDVKWSTYEQFVQQVKNP